MAGSGVTLVVDETFAKMFLAMYSFCESESYSHAKKDWDMQPVRELERMILEEIRDAHPKLAAQFPEICWP